MTGRFKNFNENRGFGFIVGEDGNDYFAHISEVKSVELPYRGAVAEFTPFQNEKGFSAKKILVQKEQPSRPDFIRIGDTRIKLSDVKSYSVERTTNGIYNQYLEVWRNCDVRWPKGTWTYLQIKFYSGGETRIYENPSFDIIEAVKQLDNLLGNEVLL